MGTGNMAKAKARSKRANDEARMTNDEGRPNVQMTK
jgi:hypothetical protein